MPSVAGIIVYRGLYFGMYDSIKPVVLVGPLEGNFLASFLLGWCVTTGAGIASYPLDTIRRRMMMTSGEVCKMSPFQGFSHVTDPFYRPSSTTVPSMPPARSSPPRVSPLSSRVLVPTFSVVLPVPVCCPSTTRPSSSCSARSSRVDLVKCHDREIYEKKHDAAVIPCGGGEGGGCRWERSVFKPYESDNCTLHYPATFQYLCTTLFGLHLFFSASVLCSATSLGFERVHGSLGSCVDRLLLTGWGCNDHGG